MEIKIIDQIQQTLEKFLNAKNPNQSTIIWDPLSKTVKEVEVQLPVLNAVNPIQSTIIGDTLNRIKSLSPEYCALSYNDLIAKYKLGFKNEQSVKLVYNGFFTFFNTYLKVIEDFGESTILIPFGLFNKILDEYGLISGPFDRYTGEVPHHVVQAIIDANNHCPSYVSKLYAIRKLTYEYRNRDYVIDILKVVNKFPFYRKFTNYEDFGDFYGVKHSVFIDGCEGEELDSHLFIAAPAHEMTPLAITETVTSRTIDPLVCSFIPHIGIIVHTSWGPEGKDIVLTLYRKLSQILKMISENEIIQTIFNNCEFEDYKPSKMAFDFHSKF